MTSRIVIAVATLCLIVSNAQAQCLQQNGIVAPGVAAVGLVTGSSALSAAANEAAAVWNNCGREGIPPVSAQFVSDGMNIEIVHVTGESTRTDGACGQFQAYYTSTGHIAGGTITIWDGNGSGSPSYPYDCSPSFGGIVAHELGHAFGLANTSASCPDYIMGTGAYNNPVAPHPDECQVADVNVTTYEEQNATSCHSSCPVACTGVPPVCDPSGWGGDPPPCGEGGPCSPLVLDMNGDGIPTTTAADGVAFDISGDGLPDRTAWTLAGAEDAFLYYDFNRNGVIDGGQELFGEVTRLRNGRYASNGFDALAEYDNDRDGAISPHDAVWGILRLWVDRNHDGLMTADENYSLGQRNISRIDLEYATMTAEQRFGMDSSGNFHRLIGTFLQRSGSQTIARGLHDIYFRIVE